MEESFSRYVSSSDISEYTEKDYCLSPRQGPAKIMRLNQREIMAREMLIRVHGCMFTFVIVNYFTIDITAYLANFVMPEK